MSADEVPAHIRLCLENGPQVLHAIECFIGAYEATGRAAAEAAHGNDAVFEELMSQTGAHDLAEILGVVAERIATTLGGTSGADLAAAEAAGLTSAIAGWYAD